jgi:FixJ family two-component response regulator
VRIPPLIAIVDDDASMRDTTKDFLESAGFEVAAFASAESLLESDELPRICCLVTDLRMPGMSGLELREQLRAARRDIPTILITAYADEHVRGQAARARVICCLAKPFAAEDLLACLQTALNARQGATPIS